jgi:glutathione S-transferase
VARIALDRLGGEEHLVGDRLTLADITFATMAAPLQYAGRELRDDDAVRALLEWGARTLGAAFSPLPAPEPEPSAT